MAKIGRLDDAFSECFILEASTVEGEKGKKERRKKKKINKKVEKPKDEVTFSSKNKILISAHGQAKMS